MKTIYLHIGSTKTGSTAIQSLLQYNQALLAQHGWLYPKTFLNGVAHHGIVDALNVKNTLETEERFGQLRDELDSSSALSVVISTESMFFLQEQIAQLKEVLSDYNVIPFVYLRNQDVWFEAMYTQTIKHEFYKYTDDIRSSKFFDMYDYYMQYDIVLAQWEKYFPGKLKVFRYEDAFENTDIREHFLKEIEFPEHVKLVKPAYKESANKSLTIDSIEFLRDINSISLDDSKHATLLSTLGEYTFRNRNSSSKYHFLSDFERAALLKRYQESNRNVRKTYALNTASSWKKSGSLENLSTKVPASGLNANNTARLCYWLLRSDQTCEANDPNFATPNLKEKLSGSHIVRYTIKSGTNQVNHFGISTPEKNPEPVAVTIESDENLSEFLNQNVNYLLGSDFTDNAHANIASYFNYYQVLFSEYRDTDSQNTIIVEDSINAELINPLTQMHNNHLITSIRTVSQTNYEFCQQLIRDSGTEQYVAERFVANALRPVRKLFSSSLVGLNNTAFGELVDQWRTRARWFDSQCLNKQNPLSNKEALDLCFTIAIVDCGLHVHQVV